MTYEFDMALLYFEEAVPFSDHVRPICLPERGQESNGVRGQFGMGYVTGWGTLWEGMWETDICVISSTFLRDLYIYIRINVCLSVTADTSSRKASMMVKS